MSSYIRQQVEEQIADEKHVRNTSKRLTNYYKQICEVLPLNREVRLERVKLKRHRHWLEIEVAPYYGYGAYNYYKLYRNGGLKHPGLLIERTVNYSNTEVRYIESCIRDVLSDE